MAVLPNIFSCDEGHGGCDDDGYHGGELRARTKRMMAMQGGDMRGLGFAIGVRRLYTRQGCWMIATAASVTVVPWMAATACSYLLSTGRRKTLDGLGHVL